ncbi:MAG: chromosome condensation regulator RCC1, partial [Rhodobacteraceae bacterium]|nr:chromosome condensation regulator RCC1 [Paracoccaceae bacterium]
MDRKARRCRRRGGGAAVAALALAALAAGAAAQPVATETELAVRPFASTLGDPVTLTATVGAAKGTPAGTVEFRAAATVLATASLLDPGAHAVDAGGAHRCTLTASGGARSWGENGQGRLGTGDPFDQGAPVAVLGLDRGVAMIAAGKDHGCAVTFGGALFCWGSSYWGQLGNGTRNDVSVPTPVTGLGTGVV